MKKMEATSGVPGFGMFTGNIIKKDAGDCQVTL